MNRYPIIDFSGTDFIGADSGSWHWVMNIPLGIEEIGTHGSWAFDVLKLQQKYGCANVTSGNSKPPMSALGVYVRDGKIKHREGSLCQCYQKVTDE